MRLRIYVLLIFLLQVKLVHAQLKCKVEHYSTAEGLSHDAVTLITKDREGFMWFGTWSGINRFDGHNFVAYRSSPGDGSQLKNDRIDQIVEDRHNHLWVKAYDHRIYRFDKKTEQFLGLSSLLGLKGQAKTQFDRTAFEHIFAGTSGDIWVLTKKSGIMLIGNPNDPASSMTRFSADSRQLKPLPSNTINFVNQDADKNIWLGTAKGLACIRRSAGGSYELVTHKWPPIMESVTSYQEDSEHIYFATENGGLIIYTKKICNIAFLHLGNSRINALLRSKKRERLFVTTMAGELLELSLSGQIKSSVTIEPGKSLYTIHEDIKGVLWLEPSEQGIIRFDPETGKHDHFVQENDGKINSGGNHYKVFDDRNGVVWAILKGGGFGYYNEAHGAFDYFFDKPGSPDRQFSNIVYAAYYDPAGILWISTDERSITKVVFHQDNFNQQLLTGNAVFKSDNEVRGICEDRKDRLWFGVKNGALHIVDHGKILNEPFVNYPVAGIGQIYTMLADHAGNIWMGTKGNGLFEAKPVNREQTKYRLIHFQSIKGDNKTLSSNVIYALLEGPDSSMWVGTFEDGLNLISIKGDNASVAHTGRLFQNYPKETFRKIRKMAFDVQGNIWMATTDGLLVFEPRDRNGGPSRYSAYSKVPNDKNSLGNDDVQFVYRDSKDRMWVATSGGGLDEAIGKDPLHKLTFRDYTTRDGLPNDYILSCTEDKRGDLWTATLNGLSRFMPETKRFRNYDSYDGLPKIDFSEASCIRTADGELVFGTTRGYLSFDPEKIVNDPIPVNMVFTDLQVNNEDVGNDQLFGGNINFIKELTLRYNQNIINIDYATLDYRAGPSQAYAYRLRGFDSVWHSNKFQRRGATYTNLPPGRYVFEVKALDADRYTRMPYRELNINILPPPWRTWWAYLLYSALFVLIAVIVRRIISTVLRLRQRIAVETRIAGLKQSFFTNVSHELRTPLTLILNPIEQIHNREKLSPQGEEYITIVQKNANRMVRFLNQLLDLRKVQSGKAELRISHVEMVAFVWRITEYFREVAREKQIKLQVNPDREQLWAWIDAEKIDIFIYNLLGNAFKFTASGKQITISIREAAGGERLSIAVEDEGVGVAPDKLDEIFKLYYEGDQAEANHAKGTGIGLALSKELTELHEGRIFAANNAGKGLTVTIELPVGRDHLDRAGATVIELPDSLMSPTADPVTPAIVIEQKIIHQHAMPGILLLVEDNAELRRFLNIQLSELYQVETAENGEEGYQKAISLKPDLVVSDIMMPVMNGIQMLDKIKNDVSTSHIPVILLSAKFSIESQIEGLRYGADYYITKPFSNEMLLEAIANLIRQRKKIFDSLAAGKQDPEQNRERTIITAKDEAFLKQVIRIVNEKMSDTNFNIDTVAENIGMGRTTFYVKLKSLTNFAPVEFVREVRLKKGKEILDDGENNISTVAYTVGFNNAKYFSKCFKEKFGLSPTDYIRDRFPKAASR